MINSGIPDVLCAQNAKSSWLILFISTMKTKSIADAIIANFTSLDVLHAMK